MYSTSYGFQVFFYLESSVLFRAHFCMKGAAERMVRDFGCTGLATACLRPNGTVRKKNRPIYRNNMEIGHIQ